MILSKHRPTVFDSVWPATAEVNQNYEIEFLDFDRVPKKNGLKISENFFEPIKPDVKIDDSFDEVKPTKQCDWMESVPLNDLVALLDTEYAEYQQDLAELAPANDEYYFGSSDAKIPEITIPKPTPLVGKTISPKSSNSKVKKATNLKTKKTFSFERKIGKATPVKAKKASQVKKSVKSVKSVKAVKAVKASPAKTKESKTTKASEEKKSGKPTLVKTTKSQENKPRNNSQNKKRKRPEQTVTSSNKTTKQAKLQPKQAKLQTKQSKAKQTKAVKPVVTKKSKDATPKNGKKAPRSKWNESEILTLWKGIFQYGSEWREIRNLFPNRSYDQIKDKGRRLLQQQRWQSGRTKIISNDASNGAKQIARIVLDELDELDELEKELEKQQREREE